VATSNTERSLADVSTEGPTGVDTTPHLPAPKDFDMAAFLEGVRPTRRSIKLYPHAHLVARLDELAAEIEQAPAGADVDDLIDEFEQVKGQFRAGVWFTVEKRSGDWIEHFRTQTEKQLGFKRTRNDDGQDVLKDSEATTISLHQLAKQIVVPTGVTYDQLRALADTNEGEASKLLRCMFNVNIDLAQGAEVLTRDFSARRSTRSAT